MQTQPNGDVVFTKEEYKAIRVVCYAASAVLLWYAYRELTRK
jgi:hypothetical protein